MIRARFVKAEPTKEGITYVLKGELDKVALHSAVDLQGEECIIGLAETKSPQESSGIKPYDDFMEFIREQFEKVEKLGIEKGRQQMMLEAAQIFTDEEEEKGEER